MTLEKGSEDAKHDSLKRDLANAIEMTNMTLLDDRRLSLKKEKHDVKL